ncbi:hypothetical protein J2W22_000451 [Sphingomonas kyeonggiensis]|uniref:hypothetical protein n=1 Tax=Sphingomonas kyeonggiensis TaxID=1268553 RepID=UPI00277DE2AF|nr:hypothetical protein [Sphingomonas kyeonggiensis]MDQ0248404.1 hypothetical protein [Sphingomonas kyeonggiensis]
MRRISSDGWQQLSDHLETESRRRKGMPGAMFGAAMGAARTMARAPGGRVDVALILTAAIVGLAYGAADLDRIDID